MKTPTFVYSDEAYRIYFDTDTNSNIVSVRIPNTYVKVNGVVKGKECINGSYSWYSVEDGLGYVPVNAMRQQDYDQQSVYNPVIVNKRVTLDTQIITTTHWVLPDTVVGCFATRNKDTFRIREIVYQYYFYCYKVNVNPLIALSQSALETDYFTSDWCVNHHNFAGIGVTGEPGKGNHFDTDAKGIHAHIGRLLLYHYTSNDIVSPYKKQMMESANSVRHLPTQYRGILKNGIKMLSGTWATDMEYAEKIVRRANRI